MWSGPRAGSSRRWPGTLPPVPAKRAGPGLPARHGSGHKSWLPSRAVPVRHKRASGHRPPPLKWGRAPGTSPRRLLRLRVGAARDLGRGPEPIADAPFAATAPAPPGAGWPSPYRVRPPAGPALRPAPQKAPRPWGRGSCPKPNAGRLRALPGRYRLAPRRKAKYRPGWPAAWRARLRPRPQAPPGPSTTPWTEHCQPPPGPGWRTAHRRRPPGRPGDRD